MYVGVTILYRVVRKGLPNVVTFGQRPERSGRVKKEFSIDFYLETWLKFWVKRPFQILLAQQKLCRKSKIYCILY